VAGVSSARVELADVHHLAILTDGDIAALREALAGAGLDERFLARLARVGERLDDPLRAPMRAWHARRLAEPAAIAARLFVLHDPVRAEEVARGFPSLRPVVGALRDAGLLVDTDGGLVARARLALAGGLFVFGDDSANGDGVPPLNGVTPVLARAAAPDAPVGSVLDLGCGAGAIALFLAPRAGRVVASDTNPRALAWTRFNARLNGIGGIELREGDLFEPLGTERFDRIVSQPPFLARRDGAHASAFAHGGVRGDELALRVVAGAAAHLRGGGGGADRAPGRAVVLADWPLFDGESIEARVRASLGDAPVRALVLSSPAKNLDEYCTSLAAAEHPSLGEPFARAACAQRDHFEALGARGVAQALVVLDAAGAEGVQVVPDLDPAGRVAHVPVRHAHDAPVTAATLDRIAAAQALAAGPASALREARLRLPQGARLVAQPAAHGAAAAVIVQLPPGRPEWSAVLAADAGPLVEAIDRSARVGDARGAFAGSEAAFEAAVRDALRRGALDVTR
jgi:methylase of polypeptide subunit release factors